MPLTEVDICNGRGATVNEIMLQGGRAARGGGWGWGWGGGADAGAGAYGNGTQQSRTVNELTCLPAAPS